MRGSQILTFVMAGPVLATNVFLFASKAWMAGSSPAMTLKSVNPF
jgi:hypothetical protein